MQSRSTIPSPRDVVHATTREGHSFPVIDITNPRFATPNDPASVAALSQAYHTEERRRRRVPKMIMRLMLQAAAKRSLLFRALFNPEAEFLDGLSTYVMKLGPDNLPPPYDAPMDRRFAAAPQVALLRLRLRQTADLIADGLADDLTASASAPLHLINIGGGPALDSVNALILLSRRSGLLTGRSTVIHVLDPDQSGPFFGANALAALQAEGRPLHGFDIVFKHQTYNWDDPAPLEALVRELASGGGLIAASSEGGLFEYGGDEAIVANLKALRAGGARMKLAAGSVTCADDVRRQMIAYSKIKLIPRGVEGFAPLAVQAGFVVAQTKSAILSDQVLLRPS
jgi:hypothetical protein